LPQLFESIDVEKRQRIINAALDEFASKGYRQATTDNIVTKAEISKGALFKYFGSKEALVLYLCDYVYEILYSAYFDDDQRDSNDFFELYSHSIKKKFEILFQYPSIYDFFKSLYSEGTDATREWLQKKRKYAKELQADVSEEYDRSKFKDDLDINKAVSVVRHTFDCLANELIDKLRTNADSVDIATVRQECDSYLAFFKQLFYKGD